jgi:hypothetical protein
LKPKEIDNGKSCQELEDILTSRTEQERKRYNKLLKYTMKIAKMDQYTMKLI